MRRSPIPFKFKILKPEPGRELIYLPKLGEAEVEELVSRLNGLGFDGPEVVNDRPKVLRLAGESATLRLMPRGLITGPQGTFERLGPSLDIRLRHEASDQPALSWIDNDYQSLVPVAGGLILHVRGRHTPQPKRFSAEVSRVGSLLSTDEALMILATVEACEPERIELLASRPGTAPDLSRPIRLEGKGFLHHVELRGQALRSRADGLIEQCLGGLCPFSPLADSTVRLKGASLPSSSKGLDDVAAILADWVSDVSYFATPFRRR
jgi:hypothetical protein